MENVELLRFVEKGDRGGVEACLRLGALIDGDKLNPLGVACSLEDLRMVNFLLEKGANLDASHSRDMERPNDSPLLAACFQGNLAIVKALLKHGADPNVPDARSFSPLHTVSEGGDRPELVSALLAAGADISATTRTKRWTVVHAAAYHAREAILECLLGKMPASLAVPTSDGWTPLQMASATGHTKSVSCILSAAARRGYPLEIGESLCSSVLRGHAPMVRVLLDSGIKPSTQARNHALDGAVIFGHATILRLLIDAGLADDYVRTGKTGWRGYPVLHTAAGYAHVMVVHVLLSHGEDEMAPMRGLVPADMVGIFDRSQAAKEVYGDAPIDRALMKILERRKTSNDMEVIRRMLARGPAYRALSWAWTIGSTSAASRSNESVAAQCSAQTLPQNPKLCVRIFRRPPRCRHNPLLGAMTR